MHTTPGLLPLRVLQCGPAAAGETTSLAASLQEAAGNLQEACREVYLLLLGLALEAFLMEPSASSLISACLLIWLKAGCRMLKPTQPTTGRNSRAMVLSLQEKGERK